MCQEYLDLISTTEFRNYVNDCLKNIDYIESVDYGQLLKVRKQFLNRNKAYNTDSGINWFNSNNQY
jgi:DNA-dependent RNA polymerase auxiliary subunit epsilon